MTREEKEKIVQNTVDRCLDVLKTKGQGYATDNDALHNFRVAAQLLGCTTVQALAGMMVKHTVSIYDMISSRNEYPQELWDEKICDSINYMLLLRVAATEGNT